VGKPTATSFLARSREIEANEDVADAVAALRRVHAGFTA
jgi:hypothetical protein